MAKNTVVVSILADTKAFQKGLSAAGEGFKKFAAAGAAVAAVGAAVAVAVGVKAVKSASALEQAMGGLNAVFKDNAGQMEQWASSAASNLGLAKSEYADLATVIGSQLKNMGLPMEAVAGQTNDLITLGADLAAQFGGSTSDAVSALSALLRGERDPIERYGVSINEAAVKAKMAEMGLSGLSGEAEKNAKLQATLALLTQQTADAQGAFAREANTLAGAQARAAAGTENLFAQLGTALLPAVTAVTSAYGDFIAGLSNNAVFTAFVSVLGTASTQFADFLNGLKDGSKTFSDFKFDFSAIDFTAAIASFNSFRDAVIRQAPGIITALIDGLVTAASALGTVAPQIITALVNGLTVAAPTILTAAVSIVDALVRGILTGLPNLITAATGLVQSLVDGIALNLPTLLTLVAQIIPQVIGSLLTALPSLIIAAQDLIEALVVGIVQAIPVLMQGFTDMWAQVLPSIMEQYPAVVANGIQLFLALVEALATAIPQIVEAWTAAYPQITDVITAAAPQILEAGKTAFLAIVQSVVQALPSIITAVVSMSPKITASIVQMMPAILAAGLELFRELVRAIPIILPSLVRELIAMGPSMASAVLSIGPALASAGGQIISGLVGGLQRSAGRVTSALTSIAGGAINAFKSMFGIASPSRLFKGFGRYINVGLADGITGNLGVVRRAMNALNGTASAFSPSFTSGEMRSTMSSGGSYASGSNTYVTVSVDGGLSTSAEIGRAVVEATASYQSAGGRQMVSFA